jgi:hypothetical protein
MEWVKLVRWLFAMISDRETRRWVRECLSRHGREQRELETWARKFFGFVNSDPERIEIFLPGMPRARDLSRDPLGICLDYPRFDEELAPDDVYTAIRVYSLLLSLYPRTTPSIICDTDFIPAIEFHPRSLRVSLGGAATNNLSRGMVDGQLYRYDVADGNI